MTKLITNRDQCYIFPEHVDKYTKDYNAIRKCHVKEAEKLLNGLYQYTKDITPSYLEKNNVLGIGYEKLICYLNVIEQSAPQKFILNSNPKYKIGDILEQIPKDKDIITKLDWIVYKTRLFLNMLNINNLDEKDFDQLSLVNKCQRSSDYIKKLCDMLDLENEQKVIYPGFNEEAKLFRGYGFHYINIVTYKNEQYIVDCTYRQFFTSTYNNLNRLGIVYLSGCRAGRFMLLDKERTKLAKEVLDNGWFKATPENIKNYFDGFAISYRNNLYYLITKDYSYQTKYNDEDYINFINGIDCQLNYEPTEVLGFQRTLKPTNKK